MNYDAFRRLWEASLRGAGLITSYDNVEEAVVLPTMARRYTRRVGMFQSKVGEPITSSMELSWEWDALLSARTRSTENDLLTELHGREAYSPADTAQPWLRIDVKLHGKVAQDVPLPLTSAESLRSWVAEVASQVNPLAPPLDDELDREGVVEAWLGEPEAHVRCGTTGDLWLLGVALEGWQGVELPRQWDDSDETPDEGPEAMLDAFAGSLARALSAWTKSLKRLLPESGRLH